jgi:tRNA (cytidine32/uridine32-2'-O)-methyltransferase
MSTVKPNQDPEQFANVRIVLVNTSHPGNIGGTARAMKNMGLSSLYLVQPKRFPDEEANWRAAGAADILEQAVVVDTLDDAIGDCKLVVGTSARERRIPWPLLTPRECGDRAFHESSQHPVAFVFGREDRGLTNEELHKCNFHVHIPANPEYSALNLATAVQVLCYEYRMSALAAEQGGPVHFDDWDQPPAETKALESYYEHLQTTLEKLTFLEPGNPRQTMTRLRRLYNRVRLDDMELSIMRGMLTSINNYIYHTDNKIAELEQRLAEKDS